MSVRADKPPPKPRGPIVDWTPSSDPALDALRLAMMRAKAGAFVEGAIRDANAADPGPADREAFADTTFTTRIATAQLAVDAAQADLRAARGIKAKSQARRALGRAQRSLTEATKARNTEHDSEAIAPAAQRTGDNARVQVTRDRQGRVRGAETVSPLTCMRAWGWVTVAHVQAGNRFVRDYEAAWKSSIKISEMGGAGGGAAGSGNATIELRVGAHDAHVAACHAIGAQGYAVLMHTLIERAPLSTWGHARRVAGENDDAADKRRNRAIGVLTATLQRLCEHYGALRAAKATPGRVAKAPAEVVFDADGRVRGAKITD